VHLSVSALSFGIYIWTNQANQAVMNTNRLLVLFALFVASVYGQAPNEGAVTDAALPDPCADVKCNDGEECVVKDGKGACECIDECPSEWNDYPRALCTIEDLTFRHECDLWRSKCLCSKGDSRCPNIGGRKPSQYEIKYYDECRDLKSLCDWDREKGTFPLRVAMWFRDLFNLKWSIPTGDSSDDTLLRPLTSQARNAAGKLFNQNSSNYTTVPGGILSYWFCEIDRDRSNSLDKNELTRLSQILSPSTPCLDEFLASCGSGSISADSWHQCFSVPTAERSTCQSFS
jgi:hypothetical protein